jgi:hypothetical protein
MGFFASSKSNSRSSHSQQHTGICYSPTKSIKSTTSSKSSISQRFKGFFSSPKSKSSNFVCKYPRKFSVKISKPYRAESPPRQPVFTVPKSSLDRGSPRSKSTLTSVNFAGHNYWDSTSRPLLSLDVAKRTDSIVKRGFEFAHNKSQEYRVSAYMSVDKDGYVRCDDKKVKGSHAAAAANAARRVVEQAPFPESPTKKVLTRPAVVSLVEANRREKLRRRKAVQDVMAKKLAQEREARQIEKGEAEKKAQAKLAEFERIFLEARKKEDLEREQQEARKRQEAAALVSAAITSIIATPKDHLVVGPTNWIVPLISLDDAKENETLRRQKEAEASLAQLEMDIFAIKSLDRLVVNTHNGSAEIRLVSLQEAADREKIRRQRAEALEAVKSHELMTARAGTGLSHVPLVTLDEARKREATRKRKVAESKTRQALTQKRPYYQGNGDSDDGGERDASGQQEKARWRHLMARTNSWWWKPSAGDSFGFMNSNAANRLTQYPDWF